MIKRLWAANKADMMTDMLMSYLGVVFAYAGPFFLRKILSELDNEQITRRNRSNAYLYAFLAFVFTLLKVTLLHGLLLCVLNEDCHTESNRPLTIMGRQAPGGPRADGVDGGDLCEGTEEEGLLWCH